MKTILFVIVFLALTFQVEAADQVFVNRETWEVKVIKEDPWKNLTSFEKEAYENPGQKVPLYQSEILRHSFFYRYLKNVANEAVIFQNGKFTKIQEHSESMGEPVFLWGVPFSILAILLMVLSNCAKLKWKQEKRGFIFVVTLLSFCATFFGLFTNVLVPDYARSSDALVFLACIAAISAAYNATGNSFVNKVLYWIFSTIFYILVIPVLFV